MPLFFFASGLFAHSTMSLPWKVFLTRKAGNIFYVYVVWVIFGWFIRFVPGNIITGNLRQKIPVLQEVVSPTGVLWFIYALGFVFLLGRLTSGMKSAVIIPLSIAVSFAVTWIAGSESSFFLIKSRWFFPFS